MPATRDLGCCERIRFDERVVESWIKRKTGWAARNGTSEKQTIIYRGLMRPVLGYVQVAADPRLFRGAAGFFRGERRAIPGLASGTGCHLGIEPVDPTVRVFAFQTASKSQKYCKAGATHTIRCPW